MTSTNRYLRQTSLVSFGEEGQAKLADSQVLVVGLGGLGLPVIQYLNAMGVGTIGLVDHDTIELHNLQRQVLYTEADLGRPKLEVAIEQLQAQNSNTKIIGHDTFLNSQNALEIIKNYEVVVDATDNFATRYLINDACILLNKPFVYGALHDFEGQVSVFNYQNGPSYRCLFPKMPGPNEIPNCDVNGVLGVLPGIIGTMQALETIKVLTGVGEVLSGKLLLFDGLQQQTQTISFEAQADQKNITQLQASYESQDCLMEFGVSAETFLSNAERENMQLIDVRNSNEFEHDHLARAINIPLSQLADHELSIRDERPVYLICQSGQRSALALRLLTAKYPTLKIYHILGGMNKLAALCP
ncbi:MAG: sulfurtransferase [Croceitalea sp.]|nr:sulfurtransferase [Croceitalea sp.]